MKAPNILIGVLALAAMVEGEMLQKNLHLRSNRELELEDDIEAAIVSGLDWLVGQQNADGSWGTHELEAHTGLAVLKLESRAIELGLDPLDPGYLYSGNVQSGLDYLVTTLKHECGPADVLHAGPCANNHVIYRTSIGLMAFAASGNQDDYGGYAQALFNFLVWAQVEDCGVHNGGWRYVPNQCTSDNSNTGWVTLGLGYAQASHPWGFGFAFPEENKAALSTWIDAVQNDVDGDDLDGGSAYHPGNPSYYVNILKTGNLLYEMALVGDTKEMSRVQAAIHYIERHWDNPLTHPGWRNHRQAMFTMMKGLDVFGILELDTGSGPFDWFAEVAQHLIDTQQGPGNWPVDPYGGSSILSTTWALLTLERHVPKFDIHVPVDVKPRSCRNPLNVKSKGVLPVAILGTEDFDATQVDPTTVVLYIDDEEDTVSPIRWNFRDVATPYEGYLDQPLEAYACTTDGPDGHTDLTMKFNKQEVISVLTNDEHGAVVKVHLKGALKEDFGATPIFGEDVIQIINKKKW